MRLRNVTLLAISLFWGAIFTVQCSFSDKDQFAYMAELLESELDDAYQNFNGTPKSQNAITAKSNLDNEFWAGNLWLMFELTGDEKWKERALEYTLPPDADQWNSPSALLGAKMMSSFGHALKYYDNKKYRDVLVQSAKVLSSSFNPVVGAMGELKADSNGTYFSVDIESMLNIDLLFWAAKETGNENFRKIAIQHVQTSLEDHFREDRWCNDVVVYDLNTGEILKKYNHHSPHNKSCLLLGQAVALHGVTIAYRETFRAEFLTRAKEIARFIINQPLHEWDRSTACKGAAGDGSLHDGDLSIGVLMASLFYELGVYAGHSNEYIQMADKLLAQVASVKFPDFSTNENRQEYSFSVDDPLNLQDDLEARSPVSITGYYFLESLLSRRGLIR